MLGNIYMYKLKCWWKKEGKVTLKSLVFITKSAKATSSNSGRPSEKLKKALLLQPRWHRHRVHVFKQTDTRKQETARIHHEWP